MYNTILLDLDGTITDSAPGITRAAAYALKQYGIFYNDLKELNKFVGPPLIDSFQKYDEITDPMEAVDFFREYYREKGMFDCTLYKGIEKLLIDLKDNNKQLIIATSKPEHFAKKILKHYQLDHYFTFIAGATMDESRNTKDAVIKYALESCNQVNKSEIIMVGDRYHDIDGANSQCLDSVGVLYGYGSYSELSEAGATYIVESVEQLSELLLK